jgi:ectoine hydroxylase-related dioxygenase (phytanoyl-CoA dioxygenase family)
MWFIPRKEFKIEEHMASVVGGALSCEISKENAVCIPLEPGGATFHDGFTPHFSEGNTTESDRRALILNFRPIAMIELERSMGVDHQGERKVRNK